MLIRLQFDCSSCVSTNEGSGEGYFCFIFDSNNCRIVSKTRTLNGEGTFLCVCNHCILVFSSPSELKFISTMTFHIHEHVRVAVDEMCFRIIHDRAREDRSVVLAPRWGHGDTKQSKNVCEIKYANVTDQVNGPPH